jgi:hypothetical protein
MICWLRQVDSFLTSGQKLKEGLQEFETPAEEKMSRDCFLQNGQE